MSDQFPRHSCPRAVHTDACAECGTDIPAGETYLRIEGEFDGLSYDVAVHLDCHQAHQRLNSDADICIEQWKPIADHLNDDPVYTSRILRGYFPAVAERYADILVAVN